MYSIQFLAKSLYPDEFTTIDLETTKNDMLTFLYGIDFK